MTLCPVGDRVDRVVYKLLWAFGQQPFLAEISELGVTPIRRRIGRPGVKPAKYIGYGNLPNHRTYIGSQTMPSPKDTDQLIDDVHVPNFNSPLEVM